MTQLHYIGSFIFTTALSGDLDAAAVGIYGGIRMTARLYKLPQKVDGSSN